MNTKSFTHVFTQIYIFNPILNPAVKALFGTVSFRTFTVEIRG